jgi:hypothetical protein
MTLRLQPLDQMMTNETTGAGYQDSSPVSHVFHTP